MYMSEGSNSSTVFNWFVNITTVAGLIGWIVIEGTYLRFYACLKKQGYSRDRKFFLPLACYRNACGCGSAVAD
jgi:amino acid transporter